MTREEAIETVYDFAPGCPSPHHAESWVETFERLGILKLDEPKDEAEEKFLEAVRSWPIGWRPCDCLENLKARGLKIVSK